MKMNRLNQETKSIYLDSKALEEVVGGNKIKEKVLNKFLDILDKVVVGVTIGLIVAVASSIIRTKCNLK